MTKSLESIVLTGTKSEDPYHPDIEPDVTGSATFGSNGHARLTLYKANPTAAMLVALVTLTVTTGFWVEDPVAYAE